MLAQSVRNPAELQRMPSGLDAPEPGVAVLLNANARKVGERVIRAISHVVPKDDLFVSRSATDARRIALTVLERGYGTVFLGGGDGTFVGFTNELIELLAQPGRFLGAQMPRIGMLKLGTGNGLATYVNASSLRGDGILDDVLRARAGEVPGYRRMELVQVDGVAAPFAGVGVDGKILNDYLWVKNTMGRGFLQHVLSGPGGYLASVALRTVPYYCTHSTNSQCEVRNGQTGPAYRLAPDGSVMEEVAPGGLLFRGKLMMASAATIPFYGFGFKMFPFAGQRRGMMNVRLGAVNVAEVLSNLPKLWKGKWFPENKILDFHATSVDVQMATAMAFQVGGDAAGYRNHVRFGISPQTVEMVDYTGALN